MSIKSLLMPAITQRMLSAERLSKNRADAERVRVSRGQRHQVHYFHQADDPYSALAGAALPRLLQRYDVELLAHVVPPPGDNAAPERERLVAYSRMLTIHIMAAFAEHEARRISERTRDALAAAKARGIVLGATGPANLKRHTEARQADAAAFSARLMPMLNGFASQGMTQRAMVAQLNGLGIKAPRGGTWSLGQVQRIVKSH